MVGHTEFLRIRIGGPLGISLITQPVLLGLKQRRAPVPCVHEEATRVLGKQGRTRAGGGALSVSQPDVAVAASCIAAVAGPLGHSP